jgi:hypothetical protein
MNRTRVIRKRRRTHARRRKTKRRGGTSKHMQHLLAPLQKQADIAGINGNVSVSKRLIQSTLELYATFHEWPMKMNDNTGILESVSNKNGVQVYKSDDSTVLEKYANANGWDYKTIDGRVSVSDAGIPVYNENDRITTPTQ